MMAEKRTAQQIFDKVVAHLRSMKARSMIELRGSTCAYRGEDSKGKPTKCAAGSLIPDDVYSETMEGALFYVSVTEYEGLHHLLPHATLIQALQHVHDFSAHWGNAGLNSRGEKRLANVAVQFGLTYTPKGEVP
jgi:hypothetical protein